MKVFSHTFYHTAIIGGGAAGLFCAGSFKQPKIILEANEKLAQKVRISGGGKCNFSNRYVTAANYRSQNKHFCKNALAAFKATDFLNLLDEQSIPWEEREHGRLFAKNAQEIAHFLIQRAKMANSQIACSVRVLDVQVKSDGFWIYTSAGVVQAQHVVLATGGLSYPSLGANPFGFQLARKLGLNVLEPTPVLCGLVFPRPLRTSFAVLAGNSLPVRITCEKHIFEDQLLFTHEGISGPAVLQTSLFWQPGTEVEIDFLPGHSAEVIFRENKQKNQLFSSVLSTLFPGKIARVLLDGKDVSLANASREQVARACKAIHHFRFTPDATNGYTKAEATAGGIDTRELNPSTLQARKIPGLYVVGEVMDVTGQLGGFNLHWAWCSGAATACDLAKKF